MNLSFIHYKWFRNTTKIGLDIIAFSAAFILSHLLRFSLSDFEVHLDKLQLWFPIYLALRLGSFFVFRMYSVIWRYAGVTLLNSLIKATTLGTVAILVVMYFIKFPTLYRTVLVLDWMMVIFICGGVRLAIRYLFTSNWRLRNHISNVEPKRVLVYGAGQAGELLLRNIQNSKNREIAIVGFIDDDPNKNGHYLHNKPVLGNGGHIGDLARKYDIDSILISIPSLSGYENRKLLQSIRSQLSEDIEIKTIPGLFSLMNGTFSVSHLRNFEIKDLLRRKPVELDFTPVKALIKDKVVMVVGGGGSIGSELCYQVVQFEPSQLIILDNGEFNVYNTERALKTQKPKCEAICLVVDATDEKMMRKVFAYYHPDIVFHAAAYKHVPMMELNPWSAVHNNITCTLVLSELSKEYDVEQFILISTDKAVQPSSVMGATKRICELIVQIFDSSASTKFITVRFGNVLGSSGSVIPKFKEQIEAGGPLTITHPEISRYFMLTSEAVELVLQAASIGDSGSIYVLDMGEPIKIVDLAKYMIELCGFKPDEDIKIEFVGMRPGEKLRESLYLSGEESATQVPNLLMLKPKHPINGDYIEQVKQFAKDIYAMDHDDIRNGLKKLVPGYAPTTNSSFCMPFVTYSSNAISVKYDKIVSQDAS